MQSGKNASIGAWEDERFIGAVVFTMGSGGVSAWAPRVGLTKFQVAELARVALRRHQTPVSRIIAIAIKMLRKQSPGLRLLVSYADPAEGHHGGIYQAGGWTYVGKSAAATMYKAPDGHLYHSRSVSKTGVNTQFGILKRVPKIHECEAVPKPGKHKYLLALDAELARRIETLKQPYPKRVGSIPVETAVTHTVEGGSTPTPTLQSHEERVLC